MYVVVSKVLAYINSQVHKYEILRKRRQRKRESGGQASEAQREQERQRISAREKGKGDTFLLEEQHEHFLAAVTK